MKIDMVKYYFKDPNTGVEMSFSKTEQWGYAVAFHVSKEESILDILVSDIKLPWPDLSESEQRVVNANYDKLYKSLEDEDE